MTMDSRPDSEICSRNREGMFTLPLGSMAYSYRPRKIMMAALPTFPHNYPLAAIL